MALAVGSALVIIFFSLSAMHFYWVFGGKWGMDSALPANEDSIQVLKPKPTASIIVGVGLLLFAVFYLVKMNIVSIDAPNWLFLYAGWVVPLIFALRVIGDFKYVGLFKQIKSTKFARADNKYFIPLCAFLAIGGFIIQMYS